jgi:hypothetical protein
MDLIRWFLAFLESLSPSDPLESSVLRNVKSGGMGEEVIVALRK